MQWWRIGCIELWTCWHVKWNGAAALCQFSFLLVWLPSLVSVGFAFFQKIVYLLVCVHAFWVLSSRTLPRHPLALPWVVQFDFWPIQKLSDLFKKSHQLWFASKISSHMEKFGPTGAFLAQFLKHSLRLGESCWLWMRPKNNIYSWTISQEYLDWAHTCNPEFVILWIEINAGLWSISKKIWPWQMVHIWNLLEHPSLDSPK